MGTRSTPRQLTSSNHLANQQPKFPKARSTRFAKNAIIAGIRLEILNRRLSTYKAFLILGRFTPERKAFLDALREELRRQNHILLLLLDRHFLVLLQHSRFAI